MPPHCATEQGKKDLPVSISVNDGEPAATIACDSEMMLGGGRLVEGVVIVNGMELDDPVAADTDTKAVPGNAVSVGRIEAVS